MGKKTEMLMSEPLPAKFINGPIPLRHAGFRNRCIGSIIFTLNHGKKRQREKQKATEINIDSWLKNFSPLWSWLLNNLL